MSWKKDLNKVLADSNNKTDSIQTAAERDQESIRRFHFMAREALHEIKVELENHGRRVEINPDETNNTFDIFNHDRLEFTYSIKIHRYEPEERRLLGYYKTRTYERRDNVLRYNFAKLGKVDKPQIIRDFTFYYQRHLDEAAKRISKLAKH